MAPGRFYLLERTELIGMNFKLAGIAVTAAAFALSGCSSGSPAQPGLASSAPEARASLKRTNLYAASSYGTDIFVFSDGSKKLLSTIHYGVYNPQAIAFDASGDLFVANYAPASQGGENIAEYSPGVDEPLRIFTQGLDAPVQLAVDANQNLYAANKNSNTITVYSTRTGKLVRTISAGIEEPVSMAFDASGNLYVANQAANDVTVYAPGKNAVLRTISSDVAAPLSIAFGQNGNLYVLDAYDPDGGRGSVTVYDPVTGSELQKIKQGLGDPWTMAFGPDGDLYVINFYRRQKAKVQVFSGSDGKLVRSIANLKQPRALTLDGKGNLYVGETTSIAVFASGSTQLSYQIKKKDLFRPYAMAFGP
jgi:DNA-binding beta-propeller fold protein YncE